MAEKLTPQQEAVVKNRGGKLLVSAAAGSGKTKVLVDRLLLYLTDPVKPANLDDFLIITFTKAAASELRGKIAEKLSERIAQNPGNAHLQQQMQRLYLAKISTVHSFCSDILKEYAYKLDIPGDFRIAEPEECRRFQDKVLESVLEQAYSRLHEDKDLQAFMQTQGLARNDVQLPNIIIQVYESARCHSDPGKWLEWCLDSANTEDISDASETVWGKYLIEEFHRELSMQISAMEKAVKLAEETETFEKAAGVLSDDLSQLRALHGCTLWEEIAKFPPLDYRRLAFPRKTPFVSQSETIKFVRNECKEAVKRARELFADDSAAVLADMEAAAAASRGLIQLVKCFGAEYDRKKRSRHVMDYSDLEHGMLDLLLGKQRSGPTAVARELGARFREIMVDEYQDTNEVQDTIFSQLSRQRNNCFMVGDVKQSIYQFRLADPGIFLKKYNTYTPADRAEETEPRKIVLSNNFRSSDQVIGAVNDVFTRCMSRNVGGLDYGAEEMLYAGIPDRPQQSEPEIELYCLQTTTQTYVQEAALIADRIAQLLDGTHTVRDKEGFRPIVPEDIVILLRSPRSNGGFMIRALQEKGIRCVMEKSADLLQTEEVGTLLALLQTVHNPLQDIPLAAVLCSRVFGFTADDLARLRAPFKKTELYSALQKSETEKARDFLAVLDDLRQKARTLSLWELVEYSLAKTRLDSIYGAMEDGARRTANLQGFCAHAAAFSGSGSRDLASFIDHAANLGENGLLLESESGAPGAVSICSIHKSKGLEYPVVILGCLSREFNDEDAQKPVLCHKELGLGLNCVDTVNRVRYPTLAKKAILKRIFADAVSEEMRILYVAMTRAKDRLIMTHAYKYLPGQIAKIAAAMDIYEPEYITSTARCPGKWILYTALHRTEAGELFALGQKPAGTEVSRQPWLIRALEAPEPDGVPEAAGQTEALLPVPDGILQRMEKQLSFRYPWEQATRVPSKQTATQLKGRVKDQEAAENTPSGFVHAQNFRRPGFAQKEEGGVFYGNAIHTAMQYLDFHRCSSLSGVEEEIGRLLKEGYLTREQAMAVHCRHIHRFFQTELGRHLAAAPQVLREFKFSLLEDAGVYYPHGGEEKILMQGVVDCAVIEEDGITVLDFKSDSVSAAEAADAAQKYTLQVMAYARAVSRIFQKPIKKACLYFFRCGEFADLPMDTEESWPK